MAGSLFRFEEKRDAIPTSQYLFNVVRRFLPTVRLHRVAWPQGFFSSMSISVQYEAPKDAVFTKASLKWMQSLA